MALSIGEWVDLAPSIGSELGIAAWLARPAGGNQTSPG